MDYKYKRKQIFGKRLKVPKNILDKVYSSCLYFSEFIEYNLEDKIPISCLIESDRKIVQKFGIEKSKLLDWELINKVIYTTSINFRDILMSIDSDTENINYTLYELVKDKIKPSDYSSQMKEVYSSRIFDIPKYDSLNTDYKDISIIYLKRNFNNGTITLKEIVNNWFLFKDKDLSYCLLNDEKNINHITTEEVKLFMSNFNVLSPLIDIDNIYEFINNYFSLSNNIEKQNYLKLVTDNILSKVCNRQSIKLTDEQYKEIFRFSSIHEFLKNYHGVSLSMEFINELDEIPKDYLFNMPFSFNELLNYNVLIFVETYGLKNIVDFDNECGHFFTRDNCKMLKSMYNLFLKYANNNHDIDETIFTKKNTTNNYIIRTYTKNEFYEAIRRMIIYGSSVNENSFDYSNITGEFRKKFPNLFISVDAPVELQKLFYTKKITPKLLYENPLYVNYLNGKELSSCFKKIKVQVDGSNKLYENFYKFLSERTDFNTVMNFIREYHDVISVLFDNDILGEYNIKFNVNDDINEIQDKLLDTLRKLIIEKGLTYPTHIPKELVEKYPSMFLDKNAPQELQEAFYSRTITSKFILSNPAYRDYLNSVDLECLFKYMPVGIIPKSSSNNLSISGPLGHKTRYHQINFVNVLKETFSESDVLDVMLIYGKYVEQVYEVNNLKNFLYNPEFTQDGFLDELDKTILQNIVDGNMKYDESIPSHFKNNNPTLFLGTDVPQEIKDKFYNREFTLKDFNDNPELFNIFENTNIACAFSENMSWIIPLFNDSENFKTGNYNRMKVISAYSKIQDVELQKAFKEYVMELGTNIDVEKIEYVSEVLSRLSLSNSSEIFTFRKELATQILKSNNPLESLSKIEDVFIRNNIPTVGKIYSCFEILHPDFQGFNFESSMVSPVLKKSSIMSKKVTVFSDLIKSSFGSNNKSVNAYLKNIEFGSNLYESIKSSQIQFDSLGEAEMRELTTFCSHLATLYNNTMKAKKNNETFKSTGYVLTDILELSKKLSPDGTLDYNLADRVIRMFCGFTGIDTLEQAKEYIERKVKTADLRNRNASSSDMVLEQGDFIKGIGGITYLRNILQNGSVSKEYLGSSAGSDATPLDTDVSMISSLEDTISDKIKSTAASNYGPIWLVLKNDDRFLETRTRDGLVDVKRDLSKLEVFYTGYVDSGHYGIRTGFASSEINYIVMESYDYRVGLEIAMNGFYIPVVNKEGKIVFTPRDYDLLREKMSGLSYFDEENYNFSKNLVTDETEYLFGQIDKSNYEVQLKREIINSVIKSSLEELGLHLKTNIDGDLSEGYVDLIDTGSTGRGTNKPGDGDFDFMLRLDKAIISNPLKLEKLKQTILKNLNKEVNPEITSNGDFRLKDVQIDSNILVDIDITFTEKTDKLIYSTDMSLVDRLSNIKRIDAIKYKYVIANILLAKQVLKNAKVYKPNRGETPEGGLGGVGIENWILQNGGSFIDAAKSFIEVSNNRSFDEFKNSYQIWDFGDNHLALRRGQYPHDNFADNMSEEGYIKMREVLKEYLNTLEMSKVESL